MHGTVVPTREALEEASFKKPFSDGFVIVLREKDAKAAAKLRTAAQSIPKLTQYWLV